MSSMFDEVFADASELVRDVFAERNNLGELDGAAFAYAPPGRSEFSMSLIAGERQGAELLDGEASREKRTELSVVVESAVMRENGVDEIQANASAKYLGRKWQVDHSRSKFGASFVVLQLYVVDLIEESHQRKGISGSV